MHHYRACLSRWTRGWRRGGLWRRGLGAATTALQELDNLCSTRLLRNLQRRGTTLASVVGIGSCLQQSLRTPREVVRRHAVQGCHAVCVQGLDVGAARDEEDRGLLVLAAHAAHVERAGAAGGDVIDQVGILVQQRAQRRLALAQGVAHGRVATASVHRTRARVVVLVLPANDYLACGRVALHNTAVDSRTNSVRIRVKALAVSLAGPSVLLHHSRRVGIMCDPHAICTVVLPCHSSPVG
mmetsp:Transcript_101349/g.295211  ORF Transcript_101349/g.295211 Transcript_101349/m.295211 type:complete len:240 (-) Transcript_101349:77-796(-)